MLVIAGCTGEGDRVRRDAGIAQEDVEELAGSLEGLVVAREPIVVRTCQNHGSGPIPPTTKIDLALRDGMSLHDVQTATATALREQGYEVRLTPDEVPSVLVGRRQVSESRAAEIRLYDSTSSDGDAVIGTALAPPVTC